MVDYISNTQDVRELASSVGTYQWPDPEIQEEQRAAYIEIASYTHKFDWSTNDPEFYAIQKLEAQLAKCYIFEHYGGPKYAQQIDAEEKMIYMKLDAIKDNMQTVTEDEEESVTRTDYKSWILNTDIPYESKLDQSLRADDTGVLD